MELRKALLERRSIRAYLDKPVEKEKLDEVLLAAAYAPSAMNNQDRQFVVITDKAALAKINEAVYALSDAATRSRIAGRSENGEFNFFYNAPVLIAACCDPTQLRPVEDCACALQNMFLAAYGLGLGSCWINQLSDISGDEPVKGALEELGMKKGYRVYGCCALGYAATEGKLSRPKANEIIIN